jgi:hypothetical protein
MGWYKNIKIADYDMFRNQIDDASRQNPYPFKDWFDESGRVYIPFNIVNDQATVDPDVSNLLEENNCQITDYRGGYCAVGNRTYRIGKFLNSLKSQYLQRLQQQFQNGEIYNLEREIQDNNSYFDDILNTFINSSYRSQKQSEGFSIVISQDPHDVAQMSTDRSWTSCMQLGEGSHYEDIFCEVSTGGLVAYLINNDDEEIQDPLARIHIRRFENKEGQSFAVPEGSVYGNEVKGFQESVSQWITQQQGSASPGIYSRKGGEYSDTFGDEMLISPTSEEDVIKWFRGEADEAKYSTWMVDDALWDDYKSYKEESGWQPMDGDMYDPGELISDESQIFDRKEDAEKYYNEKLLEDKKWGDTDREEVDNLMGNEEDSPYRWLSVSEFGEDEGNWRHHRHLLREMQHDNTTNMEAEAASVILKSEKGTYPTEIINEVKEFALSSNRLSLGLTQLFYSKYPELLNEEDIKSLKDKDNISFVKNLPKEKQTPYLSGWIESVNAILDDYELLEDLDIKQKLHRRKSLDVNTKATEEEYISMLLLNKIEDYILYPLKELFNPIPEPIIQKLTMLSENISAKYNFIDGDYGSYVIKGKERNFKDQIDSNVVHALNITGSDTPSVQRYYKSLLPRWKEVYSLSYYGAININNLGSAIASLGENGKDFIPFITEQLEKAQDYKDAISKRKSEEGSSGFETRTDRELKVADKIVEKFLYILDAVESGTGRSKKYKFYKSNNWYKTAL